MRTLMRHILLAAATLLAGAQAPAATITLFDHALKIDGTVYGHTDSLPAHVNAGGFDPSTGIGTLTLTMSGAGNHTVGLFVDHEIDEAINTFFNERGAMSGSAAAGLSWEIDEPGFLFGDIYDHFMTGALDNTNAVPAGQEDDVAMALAWNFLLDSDETATIRFIVSSSKPANGLLLAQSDPDSDAALYFWSTLSIQGGGQAPEPASAALVTLGVLALCWSRRRRVLAIAAGAASALFALTAHAAAPVVKTVPWVASNPLIPHTTFPGKSIRLKGTSDLAGAGIQYSWDFGDGSPAATGTVANGYAIEAAHSYAGLPGTVWTARLTVLNMATGESANRAYYVEMKPKTLDAEVNVAIDEGLWYLHKAQNRFSSGGVALGDWTNVFGYYGLSAANVNAFLVNGHSETGSADNPYTETAARGVRRLFDFLGTASIGTQTNGLGTFNPDANGNGIGTYVNQSYPFYQGGMFIDALVATGTPNAIATRGPANIVGRTYRDIVQDLVDYYAYCQYDGSGGGGWRYNCNEFPDNSSAQWGAIGLIAAQRHFGAVVPALVKNWNRYWLNYTQHAAGYFGYTNTAPVWGPFATTPSGMVQMAMDGIGRGTPEGPNDPSWDRAETYMRDNFANGGGSTSNVKAYYYGLFSFTKSMLLHDSNGDGIAEPITLLRSMTPGVAPIDWYAAETSKGDPTNGVARTLVNDQLAAGYWIGHDADGSQYPFETAWAIMMLNRTVFESGVPVAVAKAVPNPALVGQTITLDGSDSFHQDAARKVDSWQWDLNNDGIWDFTGPVVTTSFAALGSHPVTLRVTDDGAPEKAATTTMMVQVTIPPSPPTANANGPYSFCPATANWFLDGSGSVNPDDGQHQPGPYPGDMIQSWLWDLDGDGSFGDASGPMPSVKGPLQALGVGSHLVQLKVTDTTAASYPASGQGNLSSVASATVHVRAVDDPACACIANLAARPKSGKVQLTWTPWAGAAGYNVYRGTLSGGPYVKIGTTASTWATWLDDKAVNGTTYHYVVRPAAPNTDELCQSNQASAKAAPR
ncbi:PKD domain-containing protein [Aquabacterium humicola]|uniref:PKD domain-containing protein n=1 Tax=Aquabacterium humicola TaxID=3237377 RepID=UPI002543AF4B|nr:PKD domain-containing protein [Rubrivivax pictus]